MSEQEPSTPRTVTIKIPSLRGLKRHSRIAIPVLAAAVAALIVFLIMKPSTPDAMAFQNSTGKTIATATPIEGSQDMSFEMSSFSDPVFECLSPHGSPKNEFRPDGLFFVWRTTEDVAKECGAKSTEPASRPPGQPN